MSIKHESFDMSKVPEGLDKRFLVKITAKTAGTTDHTKDPSVAPKDRVKRLYTAEELAAGARTLSMRPINVNHGTPIPKAFVVFSQFIGEKVEALCYIPSEEYMAKLRSGAIKNFSIEEVTFDEVEKAEGMEQQDIVFTGLALVEPPAIAGDRETGIQTFFEGFNILCEIEGVADPPAPPPEPDNKKLKELEAAVTRLSDQIKTLETSQNQAIDSARREAKLETIHAVESVIPHNIIVRQGSAGMVRLTQDIKRVLRDEQTT